MEGLRGRALVVDDDALNRMILSAAVEGLGLDVETAGGGEEALARLEKAEGEPLDVVLLDLMMPGLDGFGVLAALGGNGRLGDLPVVVVSALEEIDGVVRCLEAGACDFLPKPADPVLLRTRLKAALASRRLAARDRLLRKLLGRDLSDADVEELLRDGGP